jgi:redox-sensitive bicupin YhaK (pirin superfamily)
MRYLIHSADSRGKVDFGWLQSRHSFSFGHYYDPERMHFGALRVLNDDTVAAGRGFDTHSHSNMEIISIPLEGQLEHKDSMGNRTVIAEGDVQVMSAGTGVYHSEYNHKKDSTVKFLQIWIFPNKENVTPRYDQITLDRKDRHNKLQKILTPAPEKGCVWIHQDAWFHISNMDKGTALDYSLQQKGNGVYLFVLNGSVHISDVDLRPRDALGIWETDRFTIASTETAEILIIEVPMAIP